MRVLVTGCAGLIGSWVTEALCHEKEVTHVYGIDDLSGGEMENMATFIRHPHFTFEKINIVDYKKVEEVFAANRPHVVFHAAACAREGASAFQPHRILTANAYISSIMLELAIKYKTGRFVFTSSMSVAGNNECPFTEKQPRKPCDIYAISKSATEESIEILSEVHGFEYLILRPHNCFGEHVSLTDPYRNVIAIFANRLMRKENLYIYGEGHIRAFSYMGDCLPAMVRAITGSVKNQIIYVGGKKQITIEQLAEAVIEDFQPDYTPEIIHLPPRPLEVKEAWCSIDKSVKLLGYKETMTWREGVRRTVRWAKEKKGPQNWLVDNLPLLNEKAPQPWRDIAGL